LQLDLFLYIISGKSSSAPSSLAKNSKQSSFHLISSRQSAQKQIGIKGKQGRICCSNLIAHHSMALPNTPEKRSVSVAHGRAEKQAPLISLISSQLIPPLPKPF
jgi:hypothetical protein